MKPSQIIREISEIFGNAIVLKVRRFAKKKINEVKPRYKQTSVAKGKHGQLSVEQTNCI